MCPNCLAVFYDMCRPEVVCPKCAKPIRRDDELEFIKKKKRTQPKPAPSERIDEDVDAEGEYDDLEDQGDVKGFFKDDD